MTFELRRILVPTDFSETSDAALDHAIELALKADAEIHLVHVYQLPVYSLPDGAILAKPETMRQVTDDIRNQLDGVIRRHSDSGVPMRGHVVQGMPYQEINSMAKEVRADLIVMGTHGRSGLSHLLLGSVTERIVRTADVPVLSVRLPKK